MFRIATETAGAKTLLTLESSNEYTRKSMGMTASINWVINMSDQYTTSTIIFLSTSLEDTNGNIVGL